MIHSNHFSTKIHFSKLIYLASSSKVTLLVSFGGLDALFGSDEARIFSKIGPKSAPNLISSSRLDAKLGSKFRRSR